LIFRERIGKLVDQFSRRISALKSLHLPGIVTASWDDAKVEWLAKAAAAEAWGGNPPASHHGTSSSDFGQDDFEGNGAFDVARKLAQVEAWAGVVAAFRELEQHLKRYLLDTGHEWKGPTVWAFERGDAPSTTKDIVRQLSALRNSIIHSTDTVSRRSAMNYIAAAQSVATGLEKERRSFSWYLIITIKKEAEGCSCVAAYGFWGARRPHAGT
jgi:hypothetical protein